jgi:Tfp pilus assembly protein PilF
MRSYDDGQYDLAETALRAALAGNLRSARDKATAHKLLAFIYCTSNREAQCEAAFKAARESDLTFRLSRAEAGHPLWGPVFRRIARQP